MRAHFQIYLWVLIGLLSGAGLARAEEAPKRPVLRESFIQYRYANDALMGTDRDFTQGIHLGLFSPCLEASPLMLALPGLPLEQDSIYGLFLRWDGFTPEEIEAREVVPDERPFSTFLHLSHLRISADRAGDWRLETELKTGFIGPSAGGKQTQESIHRVTDATRPRGWRHQIKHDVVLDWQAQVQYRLWEPGEVFQFCGLAELSLGTLYSHLALGPLIRLGWSPGLKIPVKEQSYFYLEGTTEIRAKAYDATLQGGLFHRTSPHKFNNSEIERLTWRSRVTLVAIFGNFEIRAGVEATSREYDTGEAHAWTRFEFLYAF